MDDVWPQAEHDESSFRRYGFTARLDTHKNTFTARRRWILEPFVDDILVSSSRNRIAVVVQSEYLPDEQDFRFPMPGLGRISARDVWISVVIVFPF